MISNKINNKLESPLISVIIPVYNVEEYLDNCLHSVVNQTLKDIEIICIDDGSTGAESEILDYYAKLDNRIKIIKQDNKGLSASRNAGMKLATAPYIMFCDSDDAYDLHMCEKMLAGIQSSGADLAICDIQECFSSDFEGIKVHNAYFDIKISGLFEINVEQIPNISSVVWNKIFRKDLIQKYNLQFPEGLYWEDNPFWFAYGSLCSKIFFISEKLYTYNRHGNTITSDWFAGKIPLRLVDYIRNAIWLYNWFNTNNLYKQHFQSYWNCFLRFFNLSAFIPEVSVEGRELSCSLAIDFLNKVADQSDAEYKVAQVILGSIKQLKKENDKKIAQKARLTLARQKWLKTRKNSIPKIIHYCWFGGKPFSPLIKKCIASWKKFCPDWEIREWNESNFDVNICQYTKEAYEAKKFAFVSDYARLYALVNYGGIYLDTDCELTKPIDKFLDHEAVSGFENEISIQTAVMGCQEGFPLFKELLERYTSRRFVMANGLYDQTTNVQDITSFCLDLGFIPNGQKQEVCGLTLYPRDYFCPLDYITHSIVAYTKNTHVIHYFNVSWLDSNNSVTKTTLRQSLEHANTPPPPPHTHTHTTQTQTQTPHIQTNNKALQLFLSSRRFDLMFKYLYITSKRRSDVHRFYRQLYLEHEKIWNNFKEFDNPSKNSAEKFIDSFEETFVDIQKNNFDFNRPIHIWENGDIANGAHRLAICAALQKDISVKLVTSPIYQWDWSYFQQRGLQKSSSDIIALEYVKLNPNAYIVCLFPSMPMQYDDYVIRILNQYGYVYYKKEFTLSVNGCINIHKISYGKEDWIDSYDNNFANLQRRALKTTGGQQEGTMRSFVFVCDNLEKVKEAKKQIRAILNIGNYPVHINDTKEEAIELAQTFFNDNSLYMLNKLPFNQRMDRIDYLVNEFKQYIFKNGYNADDLCAMGSTPMGVFGLRKNNDFDFLHLDQDIVKPDNPIFSQHTSELSYYPVSLSEIVINPANHFFYKGVKFITLDLLKEMKKIRNQQKDMNDVRIIDEFVMGNTYYCLPFSKIPETTTKHLF